MKEISIFLSDRIVSLIEKKHNDTFSTYKAESGREPPTFDDEWLLDTIEEAIIDGLEKELGYFSSIKQSEVKTKIVSPASKIGLDTVKDKE